MPMSYIIDSCVSHTCTCILSLHLVRVGDVTVRADREGISVEWSPTTNGSVAVQSVTLSDPTVGYWRQFVATPEDGFHLSRSELMHVGTVTLSIVSVDNASDPVVTIYLVQESDIGIYILALYCSMDVTVTYSQVFLRVIPYNM